MRLNQLLESPTDDPFEEHIPTEKEQAAIDKRMKAAVKTLHGYAERGLKQWIDTPGKLDRTTMAAKRKPGEIVVMYKGVPYVIKTKDPTEVELIKRAADRLVKQVDAMTNASTTTSISVIAKMAKTKRGRWPQGDQAILKAMEANKATTQFEGIEYVNKYIEYAVDTPWPELEMYVFRWLRLAEEYVDKAYKGKTCPKYENALHRSGLAHTRAYNPKRDQINYVARKIATYVTRHRKSEWIDEEPVLLECQYPDVLYQYLRASGKKAWPEFEDWLLDRVRDDTHVYSVLEAYLDKYKHGKWPELGSKILKESAASLVDLYARSAIKGRWNLGEIMLKELMKSKHRHTVDSAFVDYSVAYGMVAEPNIIAAMEQTMGPYCMLRYASEVLHKRWPAAEKQAEAAFKSKSNAGLGLVYPARIYAGHFLNGKWPALGI